jgi:hypothetical protein
MSRSDWDLMKTERGSKWRSNGFSIPASLNQFSVARHVVRDPFLTATATLVRFSLVLSCMTDCRGAMTRLEDSVIATLIEDRMVRQLSIP